MDILIFAETDDKGNFKKDAFEIASYAYEISSQTCIHFHLVGN